MNNNILRATALAAAAIVAAPAVSHAAVAVDAITHTVRANYDASFGPVSGFAVPYTGTLHLTMTPDGIINGYYRPNGETFVPVMGGRDGRSVWLDIGRSATMRVTGTLENGNIVGSAVDNRTMQQFAFNAKLTH